MDMGTTYRSSVEWVVRFAYASGATSIVANPFFIAYSAWRPATRKTDPPSVRSERGPQARPRSFSGVSRSV
jgi:hypothetical protein